MEQTYEWIRLAQAGDAAAKDNLLQENSGLIWSVVGRFRGRGEPEDLYQIGAIGLLKCIEKFDFSYDVKFSTYAVPMILGEIKRFLRDDGTVKVSRSLQEESRELSLQELAERLEVEKEELVLALESTKDVESLYASVDGNEGTLQLIDKLTDNTENEKVMERLSLMEALEHLDAKQRQIIILRYFQDRTQADVARCIGISQVQVSRIEKRVLSELRRHLQEKD